MLRPLVYTAPDWVPGVSLRTLQALSDKYVAEKEQHGDDVNAQLFAFCCLGLQWADLESFHRERIKGALRDSATDLARCDHCGGSERHRARCLYCDEDGFERPPVYISVEAVDYELTERGAA